MRALTKRLTVLAATAAAVLTPALHAGADVHRDISLILDYSVAKNCTVYQNYPKEGVVGNDPNWQINPGDKVGWRYNINATWAMISDAKYRKSPSHPWWGIVHRDCIGTSIGGEKFPTPDSSYPAGKAIPNRLLEGRSAVEADHYTAVNFRPSSAPVVNDHKAVTSKGTLRDAANKFVIGNVNAGWHVHLTSQQSNGWTKVYVPNAQRWGFLQNIHL